MQHLITDFGDDESFVTSAVNEVEIPGSMNLALCYLKTKQYQYCVKYSAKVLEVQPSNVKALYR